MMSCKPDAEFEARTDIDLYATLSLRLMVEFAENIHYFLNGWRARAIHDSAEVEIRSVLMGILDRARDVSTDGEPMWPVLGFRVGEVSDPHAVLVLPETTSFMQDLAYSVTHVLKEHPKLLPGPDGLSREELQEIERLASVPGRV